MSKREKKNSNKRRSTKPRKAHPEPKSTERSLQLLYVRDLKAIATWFGIAYQTAKDWKRNGAPERTRRGYDVHAWTLWKIHRAPARCEQEMRLKRARAKEVELRNARVEGTLVDAKVAKVRVNRIINMFVHIFETAAGELAPRLPGSRARVKKIIDEWQRERRIRLVESGR